MKKKILKYCGYPFFFLFSCWVFFVITFPWQALEKRISYYLWQEYNTAVRIKGLHYAPPLAIQAKASLSAPPPGGWGFVPRFYELTIGFTPLKLLKGKIGSRILLQEDHSPGPLAGQRQKEQGRAALDLNLSIDILNPEKIELTINTPSPWEGREIPLVLPWCTATLDGQFLCQAQVQGKANKGFIDLFSAAGQGSIIFKHGQLHVNSPQLSNPDLSGLTGRLYWTMHNGRVQIDSGEIKAKDASLQLSGSIFLPRTGFKARPWSGSRIAVQGKFQYRAGFHFYGLLKTILQKNSLLFQLRGPLNRPRLTF